VNTKFPHISTFFGDENTGEVNKAYISASIVLSVDLESSSYSRPAVAARKRR
jgi:hypothetical protein